MGQLYKTAAKQMKCKKIFCLLVVGVLSTVAIANQTAALPAAINATSGVAHKINGYKYLCMKEQGNQYDLEDKFNAFFKSIGFVIVTEDDVEELSDKEKQYVLYGSYICQLVVGGASNLTFTLRNNQGKIIFSSSKEGMSISSPKSDFKKASNKIIEQLQQLNYSFDPTLVDKGKKSETETQKDSAKEEKIKLARQMKADGMTTEQIEKYTGLALEEIDKL